MKQKTAMMELIDYMKANFDLTDESLEKFEQLLEIEKQQIIDAGNDVLAQQDPTYIGKPNLGEYYYNENYLNESK